MLFLMFAAISMRGFDMCVDDRPQTIDEVRNRAIELQAKFEGFDYASEEFWAVYDKLVVLLDYGVEIALRAGDEKSADQFKEWLEKLKDKIPSGYWK